MKKLIYILLILFVSTVIFANAPDMEFFLPTEYQFMIELDKKEARDFIQSKDDFLKKCDYINSRILDGREFPEQKILYEKGRVFSESVNGEKYIWVLIPLTRSELYAEIQKNCDWIPEYQYILSLFKNKKTQVELLFSAPTYFFDTSVLYIVNTFQIVKGRNRNKGIVHYHNMLRYELTSDSNNHINGVSYRKTKNQAVGSVLADYYLFDEKSQPIEFEKEDGLADFIYHPKNWNKIPVQPSPFLWDLKKPLKYGLQNAFDQNPETSFVENTDNDLMSIDVWIGKPVEKTAIINGYAKSKDLYKANNRIKTISTNFELNDDERGYQIVPYVSTNVYFTSFYKGTKYNDTCLAELNFFCDGEWLFGDINE